MSRYTRKTVIQAAVESTYGTDPASWGGSTAIQVSNPSHQIARDVVPRDLVRSFFGASEQLIAARRGEVSFDVELAGSGTAGTAPLWGKLLKGCGMAETVTAGTMVEYTPVTDAQQSLTIRYSIDGVLYTMRGCRGDVSVMMNAFEIPMLRFRFQGFDTAATEVQAAGTYANWQRPLVITSANSGDIKLGCTYTGATGALASGTTYISRGLELALGNRVSHLKLLGNEQVEIVGRESTGRMRVALDAATEVTWRTDLNANTLTSLGFAIGTTAGHRITVFAPSVQRITPEIEDYEGIHLLNTELRLLPSSGNDELRIVAR